MSPTRIVWNSNNDGQKDLKDQTAKPFHFVNNHSDVFLIGDSSQLSTFVGKFDNRRMNILMVKGASILDCLAECSGRFKEMQDKVCL